MQPTTVHPDHSREALVQLTPAIRNALKRRFIYLLLPYVIYETECSLLPDDEW